MLRHYYELTKPGIVYGNALAAGAGFFLASKGHVNPLLLLEMLLGVSLIIASSCVVNNYIDRNIDKKMERTRNRALAAGIISPLNALLYAVFLCMLGFGILYISTNILTVILGIIGCFFYLVMYGIWKRRSIYGTLVGSISGSIPLVAGYCSVTNRLDTGAFLLFIILALWQVPHFYALAMYRVEEYRKAGLPVLPVVKGMQDTKKHILFFITAFTISACFLTVFHYTGYMYLVILLLMSFFWLQKGIEKRYATDFFHWGKTMFRFSLLVLLIFCVTISLSAYLP